ncbi:hypothetical protein BKA70DRAFT_1132639 [Coprinopsis sp. MPI-PUGE-AT-0042]|nr:hypothetical protein BKA70DRAFT_1132639 [Coprinopsis sp. MPI-PUGE-AT-0042]
MFGGGATNPYDEIVVKATDENQTSENWEVILNLCDKVVDEGQEGSHNAVAALIKRLAHRNANVQLYALTLAEALVKNCTIVLHREISSKAFTQALEKLVTDRTAHDKVKKRALGLIAEWSADWENDTSLGLMEGLYDDLKRKGHKFDQTSEPLPPSADDEVRRKEEEELQRVLELSMKDTGGRGTWSQYSLAANSTGGAGGSSSSAAAGGSSSAAAPSGGSGGYSAPKYQAGYVPARTPSPATQRSATSSYTPAPAPAPSTVAPTQPPPSTNDATSPTTTSGIITRVRALHTFEPSEPGELAFDKGDIIKVVDRGYKDWWRGQLKGRTGIFPVNYVEPMPEPSKEELWKEAEAEAVVFGQAVHVERLLSMLKNWDVERESLADNEEIQELYRSCMSLRPKIVKLIDKYSQKRADLVSMNEAFVRARSIFDRMMEESLARHTGSTYSFL